MGRKTHERLYFMKLVAEELEKNTTIHPSLWSASQIRSFNDTLHKVIEKEYSNIKSRATVDIYGIILNKSIGTKYQIILSEESFRSHFNKGRTGDFRNYTCNRYALYLGSKNNNNSIKTWDKYLSFVEEKRPITLVITDWRAKIKSIYTKQKKFSTIPVMGSSIMGLEELSMKKYFTNISYAPLNVLHKKETFLYKEKKEFDHFENHKRALRNDQYLSQKELSDYKRILILGNPGIGKTIYARRLCNQWAMGELYLKWIPIYIELKDVNFLSQKPIFEYVKEWMEKELNIIIEQSFFHSKMLTSFFLILDGFDEISFDNQEILLITLSEKYEGVKFMLLSRPYAMIGYEVLAKSDHIIEILGFGESSQEIYAKRLLGIGEISCNANKFWKVVKGHSFLSELTSIPLTLSYLLVLFIKENKRLETRLMGIDSCYKLQQEMLYSIRQHFISKSNTQKEKAAYKMLFDTALVEGGKLAYSMEKRALFVVNNDNPLVSYAGGYELLMKLNQAGLGRLEFIESKQQKQIYGDQHRESRFSFITVAIQEYLAACSFTEFTHNRSIKLLLNFLSKNVNWNFCKMVIGKYVADKEDALLKELNEVLSENLLEYKNIKTVYQYMLFLGELDEQMLNEFLNEKIVDLLFQEVIETAFEKSIRKDLLYEAFNKILIKIPFQIQGKQNHEATK